MKDFEEKVTFSRTYDLFNNELNLNNNIKLIWMIYKKGFTEEENHTKTDTAHPYILYIVLLFPICCGLDSAAALTSSNYFWASSKFY